MGRALVLGWTLSVVGCGQSPVAGADREVAAVDLGLCVRREPACVVEGTVRSVQPFGPGDVAIELSEGSSVELPLALPWSDDLAYLDLGIHYPPDPPLPEPPRPRSMSLSLVPGPLWESRSLVPTAGFNRFEAILFGSDSKALPVPEGTRLKIRSDRGTLTVLYVVARLKKRPERDAGATP